MSIRYRIEHVDPDIFVLTKDYSVVTSQLPSIGSIIRIREDRTTTPYLYRVVDIEFPVSGSWSEGWWQGEATITVDNI